MAQMDWGVFCAPSTDYVDKTAWVESLCRAVGATSYQASADEATWLQLMVAGLGWHFAVFFGALLLTLALGALLGVMRTLPNQWLSGLASAYVEVFRNIPLVIQLFFWLYVFPSFLPATFSTDSNAMVHGQWYRHMANTSPWIIGIIGLGLYHAARFSEHVRAGIQTLSTGQWNAGFALGMSRAQIYHHTVLPQAFRLIWPTMTSEVMNLFKNTSLAFVVSVMNFFFYTKQMTEITSQDYVILTTTTLIYLFFTYVIKWLMSQMERRIRIPGTLAGDNA